MLILQPPAVGTPVFRRHLLRHTKTVSAEQTARVFRTGACSLFGVYPLWKTEVISRDTR